MVLRFVTKKWMISPKTKACIPEAFILILQKTTVVAIRKTSLHKNNWQSGVSSIFTEEDGWWSGKPPDGPYKNTAEDKESCWL